MNEELKRYLRLNLQHFAEDEGDGTGDGEDTGNDEDTGEGDDDKEDKDDKSKSEKKYSDEDFDRMFNKKFAKYKAEMEKKEREKEEAVEEAKKLAKMNADQKKDYELEKAQKEAEEMRARLNYYEMSKEASKELAEHDINASDEVLTFVVKDTAEETKESVEAFVDLVNKQVEEGVKKALSGKTPKRSTGDNKKTVTKEDFQKMTYMEKVQFKKDHPERYKQLREE